MRTQSLSTVTTDLIESYGNTARNVINAYRASGERVAEFVDQRWDRALTQSSDQLGADVRKNAQALHDLLNGYYSKSIALTSAGADALVDKVVELAGQGVTQVAANASRFEEQTGTATLSQLALAAVPAALAVSKVASQIEQKSGQLAEKIAGGKVKATVASVKRAAAAGKARARKAA
ncbi:MAG TPA: hypothetical protein VLJ57_25185 [Burkholderiaceae bacterium]|nr:hypothetical protein [Burkholderiaceae bacterium]